MVKPLQRITVAPAQIQDQQLQLTPEQVHYLRRVLRLPPAGHFIAQDGQGQQWQAALETLPNRATLIQPLPALTRTQPLVLAAAVPKQGFDEVVRHVTELGVTAIQPLLSERTVLSPSPKKIERWQRIAQEASEQSERGWVPQIHAPASYSDWVMGKSTNERAYICVARHQGDLLLPCLEKDTAFLTGQKIILAVGPEGGWTPTEISVAIDHGFTPVSLGSAILRAKTAAITAVSVVYMKTEELI
ncbi:MAG: 16S rRNA (uracil(1498)-N(3))-methyltransferase [Cyanobacteria bacterium J06648_16]